MQTDTMIQLLKPTSGVPIAKGSNIYWWLREAMVHPRQGVRYQLRAKWKCGGDISAVCNPLRATGSTPLYLWLPPMMVSGGGDCHFPITCGTSLASPKTGPTSLGNHPKELALPVHPWISSI